MHLQAVGQQQPAVAPHLEVVVQRSLATKLDRVQWADADRRPQIPVIAAALELADQ
jgi:putative transposase